MEYLLKRLDICNLLSWQFALDAIVFIYLICRFCDLRQKVLSIRFSLTCGGSGGAVTKLWPTKIDVRQFWDSLHTSTLSGKGRTGGGTRTILNCNLSHLRAMGVCRKCTFYGFARLLTAGVKVEINHVPSTLFFSRFHVKISRHSNIKMLRHGTIKILRDGTYKMTLPSDKRLPSVACAARSDANFSIAP